MYINSIIRIYNTLVMTLYELQYRISVKYLLRLGTKNEPNSADMGHIMVSIRRIRDKWSYVRDSIRQKNTYIWLDIKSIYVTIVLRLRGRSIRPQQRGGVQKCRKRHEDSAR